MDHVKGPFVRALELIRCEPVRATTGVAAVFAIARVQVRACEILANFADEAAHSTLDLRRDCWPTKRNE